MTFAGAQHMIAPLRTRSVSVGIATTLATCLVGLAGCTFDPPSLTSPVLSQGTTLDAGNLSNPDGGGPQDATNADGGVFDAGTASTTPDGGGPDAAPGTPDGATPPDSGPADTGLADTGPADVGAPDAGCAPFSVPAAPAVVLRLNVPHTVDRAVLTADLDGDGEAEVVLASASDDALSVVDFDGCGPPTVTTQRSAPIGQGGVALVQTPAGAAIVAADQGRLRGWRYNSGAIQSAGISVAWDQARNLAGSPDGSYVAVTGRTSNGGAGYLVLNALSGGATPSDLDENLVGRPAFLADGIASNPPRFAGTDGVSALLLTPGAVPTFLPDGTDVEPRTAPIVARQGVFGADNAVIVYGADNDQRGAQLRTTRLNVNTPTDRRSWGADLPSPIAGAPILLRRETTTAIEAVRVYSMLEDGEVRGCELGLDASGTALCTGNAANPIGRYRLNGSEVSDRVAMVAAYINDNPHADLVITAASAGTLIFRTSNLGLQAAPSVQTNSPVTATPAISTGFFARWGLQGDLMVVPHPAGAVTLVAWPRLPSHGAADKLWSQFRGDASRSGSL